MKKLNTSALLDLSSTALSNLSPKSPKFIINNEEFEVDILVKALSYDEVTNMFKGEDPEKITVADVVKRRVLFTVFNADTKEPLCSTIEEVGNLHPAIIGAIHDASNEVNDFGKEQIEVEEHELWCELVLNGIGGRTIEQAKKKITPKELRVWQAYLNKYGSFNLGRRIEQGVGNLFTLYFNSRLTREQAHLRVEDARIFMPHETIPELTFEEQRMQAIKKKSG